MAASDGIKQYWIALNAKPELVTFSYLDAQKCWQKYLSAYGGAKFHGNDNYIAFMQSFMMDGVKGTKLIGYLGEIYKAGSSPTATAVGVVKTAAKKAGMGWLEYNRQIADLKNAELGSTWLQGAKMGCATTIQSMAQGMDISPGDI